MCSYGSLPAATKDVCGEASSYGESHFLILHFIVTTSVEMVDVGIQSEAEDLSDTELSAPVTVDRKPSVLEAVPEEEHEDIELVITLFTPESKELVHLVAKWG